jgi:hypothetical protein
MKTIVTVEEVSQLVSRLAEINKIDIDDLILTENSKEIDISNQCKEDFTFTRLQIKDFITMRYWEHYNK